MGRGILFAGQGAQTVGMGKDLAKAHQECKALFDMANEILGYDITSICFEGPEEELTKSNHCQPAIFVTSMACYTALRKTVRDLDVQAAAGLSLGEWSALHMAGALTFADTIKLLEARGRFMQRACEAVDGSMVSVIGLDREQVEAISVEAGVEVANINSSAQIVLSGERAGIEKAEQLAKDAGAKRAIVLRVAGAFHSSLMQPAADRLKDVLAKTSINRTSVPVISNVTGRPHGSPDEIRDAMYQQVTSPVQWLSSIEHLKSEGVDEYIECGPGKVLSGLVKRIDGEATLHTVQDGPTLEKVAASLRGES